MMRVFATIDEQLRELTNDCTTKGCWISLVNPTASEIEKVCRETGVPQDILRAPLDEEEKPRLEFENGMALIIINIPVTRPGSPLRYDTLPLGMIVKDQCFITVCLEADEVQNTLISGRPGTLQTFKKTRLVLQILYATAALYLKYLRQIDRKTNEIEAALHRSMKNEELIKLLELEKGLVYFTTSLRSNQIVMEKLLRSQLRKTGAAESQPVIKMYADDEDLLEDVITENKQAIEMGDIYSSILSGMMDAFASVISNNLNIVMKFLTSVTIVLALPAIVAGFYGMNVQLPGQSSVFAFPILLGLSLALGGGAAWALARRGMF